MLIRSVSVSATALVLASGLARAQSFTEGFDDVAILFSTNGWFGQNNSDDPLPGYTEWNQGVEFLPPQPMSSHSGDPTSYALANFQATQGTLGSETISLWMVPPTVTLRNGDQIKFWTRCVTAGTTIYPDRMQVRLSTSGSSTNVGTTAHEVGDFTTLLLDINPTYSQNQNPPPPSGSPPTVAGYPVAWTQYTLVLSGLPAGGVSGRFAFRYYVENGGLGGINSNVIGVDDLEYISAGSGPTCYANCDGSTSVPFLNVNDFICFQSKFAAGDSYANCDGSTAAPVLNVNDFICFQSRFAAGCSAP
jgi:hypothetical protein